MGTSKYDLASRLGPLLRLSWVGPRKRDRKREVMAEFRTDATLADVVDWVGLPRFFLKRNRHFLTESLILKRKRTSD